jgi:sugar/nucleoside kinase (ribokinase family)
MSVRKVGPVVCVSYLAAAALWNVPRFPQANYGAEVRTIEHSTAADGPMTAAVLTALGVPSLLLANSLGDDTRGIEVGQWLQRNRIATTASVAVGGVTPQIVVVADDDGTRTWFPFLPGVVDTLAALDLSPMIGASFVYIDCYQLIEAPAVRAIHAAREAGVPLLLNLGGSPLSSAVTAAVRDCPGLVVQTNVDDAAYRDAPQLGAMLRSATHADWTVVTAGASGVVALSEAQRLFIPAFQASVRHTHCAGAAFSGGLIFGLLHDWPMDDSLSLACASGAFRCERFHHELMPTLTELHAFMRTRERIRLPAA